MLEFTECKRCGKQVRTSAKSCHHCGVDLSDQLVHEEGSPEYAEGGYSGEEDFDYEEYVKEEFGESKFKLRLVWRVVAAIMVLVLLLPFIVQFFGIFPAIEIIPGN